MFLSHKTIEKYIDEGKIIVKPEFEKKNIRPVGLRIHLAKDILIPEPDQTVQISGGQNPIYKEVDLTKEEFYLEPNHFILAATFEAVQTPANILAILDGRSTIARLGLTIHVTASITDGTLGGIPHRVVLEMKNLGNFRIRLNFRDPIAMMLFAQITEPVTQEIQSQYGAGQEKVTPPNLSFRTGADK